MPAIAILSDIHANLPALTAVLREVEECGVERVVFLGDIVGYGASPAKCVEVVRGLGGCCVMGNHDEKIRNVRKRGGTFPDTAWKNCGYQAGLAHAAKCLDADQAQWLVRLPYRKQINAAWIAHASLAEPEAFDYIRNAAEAEPTLAILRKEKIKIGFFGHTHEVGIFAETPDLLEWLDESRVKIPLGIACAVTVGAVGQPRHPTDRRAAWVLWNPIESVVEFRKTDYNRLEAANDIIEAGLPLESALGLLTDEEVSFLLK